MALEPITRQEKIIAGENLEPITRMEHFLKQYGGSGGSVGGGGSTGGGLFKVTITGTANESDNSYTYRSDKTGKEVYDAFMSGLLPYAELIADGVIYFGFLPCMNTDQYGAEFIGVTAATSINNEGKILVSNFSLQHNNTFVSYTAHVLNSSVEINCGPFSTMFN